MVSDLLKYFLICGNPASKAKLESETLPYTFYTLPRYLRDYRIYGNTVNGESVGGRTANLLDEANSVITDTYIKSDGTTIVGSNGDRFKCNRINVLPNITYIFSWKKTVLGTDINTPYIRVAQYDSNGNFLSRILISAYESPNNRYVVTAGNTVSLWDIRIDDASSTRGQHLEEVMLNLGSNALPYEPYGYRIPITNNAETANIYLDEPLAKSGNNADYIDYKSQKRYNADGTVESVALPKIAVYDGANEISIDTTIQPSKIYLQGGISETEVSSRSLQASPQMLNLQPFDRLEIQDDFLENSFEDLNELEQENIIDKTSVDELEQENLVDKTSVDELEQENLVDKTSVDELEQENLVDKTSVDELEQENLIDKMPVNELELKNIGDDDNAER